MISFSWTLTFDTLFGEVERFTIGLYKYHNIDKNYAKPILTWAFTQILSIFIFKSVSMNGHICVDMFCRFWAGSVDQFVIILLHFILKFIIFIVFLQIQLIERQSLLACYSQMVENKIWNNPSMSVQNICRLANISKKLV